MDNTMDYPIKGFEKSYAVTDKGTVVSLSRTLNRFDGTTKVIPRKEISISVDAKGSCFVMLHKNSFKKKRALHLLVAETCIPNPHSFTSVGFRDGNKQNCAPSNLYWKHPHDK